MGETRKKTSQREREAAETADERVYIIYSAFVVDLA